MRPPPGPAPTPNGITGTRPKAETKRVLAARVIRAMKAAGMSPQGWQVRSLTATLLAGQDRLEMTDEQIVMQLMRAPWFPKHRRRRYAVGEAGWRTS